MHNKEYQPNVLIHCLFIMFSCYYFLSDEDQCTLNIIIQSKRTLLSLEELYFK